MQLIYRIIAAALTRRQDITQRLFERAKQTPYRHITSRDGKHEYMRRWWLFNPYEGADGKPTERNWFMRMLPSIRFHEILRADDDEHLHDHPWDAQTIVLRGWYTEQYELPDGSLSFRRVMAGHTHPLRFGQFHRITTVSFARRQQVLTMFITWRYRGIWGFKVDGKKVPWQEYLAAKENA